MGVQEIDPETYYQVVDRAQGCCEICHAPGAEVDHIVPRSHFGKKRRAERDSLENLRLLCLTCHKQRHDGGRVFL